MGLPSTMKDGPQISGPDSKGVSIPVAGIRDRLDNLREHFPHQHDSTYEFASLLSKRLGEGNISPAGFVFVTELLIFDLKTGVDGFTRNPLRSFIVGFPPRLFDLMFPKIARVVCPPEFAEQAIDKKERLFDAAVENE